MKLKRELGSKLDSALELELIMVEQSCWLPIC